MSAARKPGAPSSPILYSYDKVLFKKWQAEISVIKCKVTSPAMENMLKRVQMDLNWQKK